ncbi:MAG: PaaI family thioesterase [Pseudomonadota bacterium]
MADGSTDPNDHGLLASPHASSLGLTAEKIGEGRATISIPYDERLIGDPDTGVVHGGVLTTMLDNASGIAVRYHPDSDVGAAIATLDLRIDYMRGARPGETLYAEAHCYKRTRNVAFVRGVAYETDRDDPIATSTAAFMLGTRNTPRP